MQIPTCPSYTWEEPVEASTSLQEPVLRQHEKVFQIKNLLIVFAVVEIIMTIVVLILFNQVILPILDGDSIGRSQIYTPIAAIMAVPLALLLSVPINFVVGRRQNSRIDKLNEPVMREYQERKNQLVQAEKQIENQNKEKREVFEQQVRQYVKQVEMYNQNAHSYNKALTEIFNSMMSNPFSKSQDKFHLFRRLSPRLYIQNEVAEEEGGFFSEMRQSFQEEHNAQLKRAKNGVVQTLFGEIRVGGADENLRHTESAEKFSLEPVLSCEYPLINYANQMAEFVVAAYKKQYNILNQEWEKQAAGWYPPDRKYKNSGALEFFIDEIENYRANTMQEAIKEYDLMLLEEQREMEDAQREADREQREIDREQKYVEEMEKMKEELNEKHNAQMEYMNQKFNQQMQNMHEDMVQIEHGIAWLKYQRHN